jgi:two-component system OmpR family response regulator
MFDLTDLPRGAERRAAPRYASDLETRCRLLTADDGSGAVPAKVRDISAGGIGLVLERSLEPGRSLELDLPLAGRTATSTIQAQVVRAAREPGRDWFLGCVFARPLADRELEAYRPRRGTLGILLADDDTALTGLMERGLRPHGFTVWRATSGEQAVELYREHHTRIGLVLLDVEIPGLEGPPTLATLREINPNVRCCILSTPTSRYSEQDLRKQGASRILKKPFRLLEVARVIWEMV